MTEDVILPDSQGVETFLYGFEMACKYSGMEVHSSSDEEEVEYEEYQARHEMD